MSSHLRHMVTSIVVGMLLGATTMLVTACGGEDRDPIRVQAATIDGQVLIVDDLADRDTVLWFWAPW